MPVIQVALTPGRSAEQKRDLITSLTRETVRSLGCAQSSVQIVLLEVGLDDWGSGGLTLAEKRAGSAPPKATS